ncbi:MAG: histidine triad nucleotide-binding protein [Firmicutes bacterium]|nr:histidine triad nucleotide-binding protein [Bacillota bacterium]
MPDCIFCRIAGGEMPTDLLFEDDQLVAFKDINPQAPVHFLVVPKKHIPDLPALTAADASLLPAVQRVIVKLTRQLGIDGDGFRVVVNTGAHGGQTVSHLHFHVLGGRALGWPPG